MFKCLRLVTYTKYSLCPIIDQKAFILPNVYYIILTSVSESTFITSFFFFFSFFVACSLTLLPEEESR